MEVAEEFKRLLEDAGARLGREFQGDLDEVKLYASERMLHLAAIIAEPGYAEALLAERDNVALKLGMASVGAADRIDRELLGLIAGGLGVAARALAAA